MKDKTCKQCGILKPISDYYRNGKSIRYVCKVCDLENGRKYRAERPKEEITAYRDQYYDRNKEWRNKNARKWYYDNHDYAKERNRLAKQTPEKRADRNAKKRERYANDPDFRLKELMKARIYRALKGIRKSNSTGQLVGCTFPELKCHLERRFVEGMTWGNYGEKWHVDHIIPCASFDFIDSEQQRRCFHYTNLQPLWKEDNMRKSCKV